jgi:hypothetical protein
VSFDLLVWNPGRRIDESDAQREYEVLAQRLESEGSVDPRLAAFMEELAAQFPGIESCVNDDDYDHCPWADEFGNPASFAILCMRWGWQKEPSRVIVELARKHGLTVYDPQSYELHHSE